MGKCNGIKLLSVDAKDLYIANNYINDCSNIGYKIRYKTGDINTKKFINDLDYSLDLIKLQEIYEKIYRNTDFAFEKDEKEYTKRVINVTFKYSNKLFNKIKKNTYVRFGYCLNDIENKIQDSVYINNNQLIAIITNNLVDSPIDNKLFEKQFKFEDGAYKVKSNIKVLNSVADLRDKLYDNGFYCDGVKFIRFKRSSGSSRVGKCLFIDEKLYKQMHKWEMCGLNIKEDQETDLAALEAYIALPTSSIIDTLEINPDNILVINDFKSDFRDDVIVTTIENGWLKSYPDNVEIHNSIWDGQSLLDESMFVGYEDKGMLLLRNKFFKSCCFNTKIQKWFDDNNITDISQLNGFTLSKKIEDIKMITTPSSIKYYKFGKVEDWMKNIDSTFGIVKYDKPTHYFDGKMVQTHYQLLNTLQLSYSDVEKLVEPSLDYMRKLKSEPSVLRYHVKYPEDEEFAISSLNSKNDIIYKMMGVNDKFSKTKMYNDFLNDLLKSYKKNLRCGHLLVEGNYSTLLGNPIEMLQSSIDDFDGKSQLGKGNIHSLRFPFGQRLLGSRSPHVTMGNILLANNVDNEMIDTYFNLTKQIVCVNSIKENLLERLSSCDFDSDTCLLTDCNILIKAAEKNYDKFTVPTSMVEAKKIKRKYNNKEKAELDVKTSINKIGEIINLSQELNTLIWDTLNNGGTYNDIKEIYYDVSKLDVMSCIEIDKAKKEFEVDNTAELKRLKEKYEIRDDKNRMIKPYFFGEIAKPKGYYDTNRKNYKQHKTSMDYLQKCINKFRLPSTNNNFLSFVEILDPCQFNKSYVKYDQINRVFQLIEDMRKNVNEIYISDDIDKHDKYRLMSEVKQNCVEYIDTIKMSYSTMYWMLYLMNTKEYKHISRSLFTVLFGTPNKSFFKVVEKSKEPIPILNEEMNGEIQLYNHKYSKIYKND